MITGEPPRRCYLHEHQATLFPCGKCEDAATRWREWKAEQDFKAQELAKSAAAVRARAIKACGLCNDDGYLDGALCRHDPTADDRTRRGIALARKAIAR